MTKINVNEAKTHLSHYLHLAEQGETIIICKRNIPIAEIKPINQPIKKRILGFAKGQCNVPESFFDPLPETELELWTGNNLKQ